MAEPIPPAENVEDAMRNAAEVIREMRRIPKDENAAQARVRVCAAIAAQRELAEAARRTMTDAIAAKPISKGNGNGNGLGTRDNGSEHHWLSTRDFPSLAKGIVPFVAELISEAVAPLKERLTELEARPVLSYEGIWSATRAYSAGSFVTHQGGLWHCEDTNVGVRPGSGSPCWKLAVKKGHAER